MEMSITEEKSIITEKNIIITLAFGGAMISLLMLVIPTLVTSNMSLGLSVGSASWAAAGVMGIAALVIYL